MSYNLRTPTPLDPNYKPPCPAPWCGKDRSDCSHVECWRRVVVTAGPRDQRPVPQRLTDEYVPRDER